MRNRNQQSHGAPELRVLASIHMPRTRLARTVSVLSVSDNAPRTYEAGHTPGTLSKVMGPHDATTATY